MPVSHETLRMAGEIRITIDRNVDNVTRDLVQAWGKAWRTLIVDWDAARREIQDAWDRGEKPTRSQVLRFEKVTRAIVATRDVLDDLGQMAGVRVLQDVDQMLHLTAHAQTQIIASQLPQGSSAALLRASLVRADQDQIAAIIRRVTQTVTSKTAAFGPVGEQILLDELIRAGVNLVRLNFSHPGSSRARSSTPEGSSSPCRARSPPP